MVTAPVVSLSPHVGAIRASLAIPSLVLADACNLASMGALPVLALLR